MVTKREECDVRHLVRFDRINVGRGGKGEVDEGAREVVEWLVELFAMESQMGERSGERIKRKLKALTRQMKAGKSGGKRVETSRGP